MMASTKHLSKEKLSKWLEQEVEGCTVRQETERALAAEELLLKIKRGYFDAPSDEKADE